MSEDRVHEYVQVFGSENIFSISAKFVSERMTDSGISVVEWAYKVLERQEVWFSGVHIHSMKSRRDMDAKELVNRIASDLNAFRVYTTYSPALKATFQAWYYEREYPDYNEMTPEQRRENRNAYDVWYYTIFDEDRRFDPNKIRRFRWPEQPNAHKITEQMVEHIADFVAMASP